MKNVCFVRVSCCFIFLFFNLVAFSQALEFEVVNNTGISLYGLHVSPEEGDEWSEDLLPNDLFEDNVAVTIHIPEYYGETCYFDILITTLDDDLSIEFYDIDMCDYYGIHLYSDGTYEIY